MDLTSGTALIGREQEVSALASAVARVSEGYGGAVWIEGAAGTGKTALLELALEQAAAQRITVLRAAGDELSAAFPLRMLADALGVSRRAADPERAALARALSGDPAADPGGQADLGGRMLEVARTICGRGPAVLAGDDLQWADEASLTLWEQLAGLTRELPLLLLGATRPGASRSGPARPGTGRLAATMRWHGGLMFTLGPLDHEQAATVAAQSLGAPCGPALRAELARAGGNPHYLRELSTALAAAGLVEVTDGSAEFHGEPGVVPAPLAASIEQGLVPLSGPPRLTVRVAALLGNGATVADVAAVAGRPAAVIADDLAEAAAAGVLFRDGPHLVFRHELVRQALASQIPAALEPALHRHAARMLAASGRRLASVAPHLLAGPPAMEDWALRWLALRSEASLYQVPQAAVELLEAAVQQVDSEDPRWATFAGQLAEASFWLGRDDGVGPMALEVARRTGDVNLACRMRIFAMRAAARSSLFEDGIAVGEAALRDPDLTDAWRARLAAWLAVLLLLSGQAQRGEGRAFDALRYAAMTGDPLATASAHQAAAFSSGTAEAVAHSGAALAALGSDAESADLRLLLLRNRLGWLVRLDDDEELERTLAAALEEADRTGTFAAVGIRGAAAHVRYRQGRWDDALAQLDRIEPEFREHGHAVRLRALTALIALHRGNLADAEAALRTAGTAVQRPPDSMEPGGSHLLVARALIGEGQGDLDLAIGVMTGWLAIPATLRRHLDFDDAPDLVRLALAAGQPELAGTVVKRLEEDAAADPVTGRILAARSSRAQLDGDAAALARAAADYRQRGWPMRRGLALEEAAVRLAQAGQQAEARAALTEATGTYAGIGASWDVRRAEARLRQHGVRRGPHSAHRTEATGWTALTPAEAQVALLAADGLSNADIATRLFVSPRTVETHVSQVLAKLQIRSRAELARAYAEQADHWRHGR